jgi:hypothetical protein
MDDVTIGKVCKDNNITFKHRQFYEMREPLENSFAYVEAHPEVFHLRIRTMNRSRDTEVYKEVVDYFLAKKSGCTL